MFRDIQLSQGKIATVDDLDYEQLNQYKWHAQKCRSGWCAARNELNRSTRRRTIILMHRAIMQASPGVQIDHYNGNGLDNRRSNLRCCTNSQNQMNSKKRASSTSRFKGVSWDSVNRKWRADITINYRGRNLGRFESELDAARTYNKAASELFGKFARANVTDL